MALYSPEILEVRIGSGLNALVDLQNETPLSIEIEKCRNRFEEEYGFSFPKVHIMEHCSLNSNEYSIVLNGIEVGRSTIRMNYHLCMNMRDVTRALDCSSWDKTKDPAFGIDGFYIPDDEVQKYIEAGYVCVKPERIIATHLLEIIRKNRINLLNQKLVKTLMKKASRTNLDAISDVFAKYYFSTSDLITLLNYLLDEEVSIRDMDTILETVADNLHQNYKIYELGEKVRQKLAYSFIKNYTDEKNVLHVARISEELCKQISNNACYPKSKKTIPYCMLEPKDWRKFYNFVLPSIQYFTEGNLYPVLVCESSVRPLLAKALHIEMPGVRVISDVELSLISKDITITVEEAFFR